MFKSLRSHRFAVVSLSVVSVLVAIALFVGVPTGTFAANPAQATMAATMAGTAAANQVTTVRCQPTQVAVSSQRVHVKCATGVGKVVYFATPTQDQQTAMLYLSLLETAVTTRKQLVIDVVMSDTSGESFGCAAADCRTIGGMDIEQ